MSILSVKNKINGEFINLTHLPGWDSPGTSRLTNSQIERILNSRSYWYLGSPLVLKINPTDSEIEISHNFNFTNDTLGIATFWRREEFEGGFDHDNFRIENLVSSFSTIQIDKMELSIESSYLTNLQNRPWIDDLEFGIAILAVKTLNIETGTDRFDFYGLKVTHKSAMLVEVILPEIGTTVDSSLENEYISPVYSFESLFIPSLSSSFVYNFFEQEEENYDIFLTKNYDNKPLSQIPKYIKLNWNIAPKYHEPIQVVVDLLTEEEVREDRDAAFVPAISEESTGETVFLDGVMWSTINSEEVGSIIEESAPRTSEDASAVYDGVITDDVTTDRFVDREIAPERILGELQKPSDYVGYVIQKERYNESSQIYEPVDLFVKIGRTVNELIDWKIAYGEVYRYKIRSIFKFVNKAELSMYKDSDELFSINNNSERFDGGAKIWETYYYDSKFSPPVEVETIETVRPNAPENLKIFPNSIKREILLTWNQKNSNKDVIGYNIYRKTQNDTFRKINFKLLPPRDNFYVDSSIDFDVSYIYAVESFDIHNNYSLLSEQREGKIIHQNPEVDRNEFPVKLVNFPGANLFERDSKKSERMDNFRFFDENFTISANPLFSAGGEEEAFVLKIKSLDIAEEKEIKLKFTTFTTYHRDENNSANSLYGQYLYWPGFIIFTEGE